MGGRSAYAGDPVNFDDPNGLYGVGVMHQFNATSGSFFDQIVNGTTGLLRAGQHGLANTLDFFGGPGAASHLRPQAEAFAKLESPFQKMGYYAQGELGDRVGLTAAITTGAYGMARQAPSLFSRIGNWFSSLRNRTPTFTPTIQTAPFPATSTQQGMQIRLHPRASEAGGINLNGANLSKRLSDLTGFRRQHILDRHRAGAGISGKSEFPKNWSDDEIIHYVSDVATDPKAIRGIDAAAWNTPYAIGVRDGVVIRVDFYPPNSIHSGKISTAYPIVSPLNP